MFAFPSHPFSTNPWSAQQMLLFPDASFDMPWGRDTAERSAAESLYGQRSSCARQQQGLSFPDQAFRSARAGVHGVARHPHARQHQQGNRKHATVAHPEPACQKHGTEQQHWHTSKQAVAQPSSSSTSCSSYSTAADDSAAEPMDVCSCPPTPPPTANNSNSYNSADSGDSNSSSRRCPVSPMQQQAKATTKQPTAQQQQQQQQQQVKASSNMDAQTAATVLQAAWRMYRLARHRQALKQLATAAGQLRSIRTQLAASTAAAAAAGTALSQKLYLELSEPVMKVLFLLDAVSCGAAGELRTIRKRLTTEANRLLDEIHAAYKAPPTVYVQQQQQQQEEELQQQQQAATSASQQQQQQQHRQTQKRRLRRLAGFY